MINFVSRCEQHTHLTCYIVANMDIIAWHSSEYIIICNSATPTKLYHAIYIKYTYNIIPRVYSIYTNKIHGWKNTRNDTWNTKRHWKQREKKIALKKKIKWDKFTMFTAKQNREWTERRMNEKKNIKNDGSWCWWWWSKYSLHKIDS